MPKKAKVQKPEACSKASTREAVESLYAEGKESDDCPLVLRGRRSVVASKSTDPKVAEPEVAGTVAAEAFKLSNQAFSMSQAELARCEDEFRKLVSELDELEALHAQKEGELGDVRAHLERISRERANLDEQLKQKDDLMREELRVRDTEILRLKQCVNEVSSDKETFREKLTLVECQLQGVREESREYKDLHAESVAELSANKSEAVSLLSSYRKNAAAANAQARKVSKEVELELSRSLEYAQLRSRR
ncbi:uncharacterized protein [Nicotiana sylvestris]|uniref:uncharacterized protein n=1 Tax=Nicotiana sylvestris TaxID=4096 RepID=UPI00388CBDE0